MKREAFFSGVLSFLLTMLICLSGLGCVVTAFSFTVADWRVICLWCFGLALAATVCFRFRWGSLILCALCLVLLNTLLRTTDLLDSLELMVSHITRLYDSGYHWGYIQWSPAVSSTAVPDGGLILLGSLVILSLVWTIICKRPLVFALLGGLFPLLLCCVLQDTAPDPLPLWLLLTGLVLLTLARSTCRRDDRRVLRLIAGLLIPVTLFSGFIFVWAPSLSYEDTAQTILNRFYELITPSSGNGGINPGPGPSIGPGTVGVYTAKNLDLTQVGPLELSKDRMILVYTSYDDTLYLRAQAYDIYTGTGWEISENDPGEGGWPIRQNTDETFDISIFTTDTEKFLFLPYYIDADGWTAALQNGSLQNPKRQQQYSFTMFAASGTSDYTPLSDEEQERHLSLPDTTRRAAQELIGELFPDGQPRSVAEQAQAIGEYVKTSAVYSLSTPKMPVGEEDFALWFLDESPTGYCVHFATAATVLLRAAGIPARYVSGYTSPPPRNHSVAITAEQAHAWVEYLDPDRGWTILEVTPSAEDPLPTRPTDPTEPTETQPTDSTKPTETQPSTEPADPTEPPTSTETEPAGTQPEEPAVQPTPMDWTWLIITFQILLVFALIIGQYRLRKWLRHVWLTRGDPNRQAVRRWKYIRRFARLTQRKAPRELYELTEKAVFSQHTLTDAELSRYDGWILQTHARLLDRPWPVKILLRLILAL